MRRTMGISLLMLFLCACVQAADDSVPPAPPKPGRTVDPPLSADVPAEWSQLPLFGTITWETLHLPWVEAGPGAGISGVAMAAHGNRIIVAGGFIPGGDQTSDSNSGRTSRWTWMLDTTSGSWQQLADCPVRREYTRGTVANGAFYLVGGACQYRDEDPRYRPHGDVMQLDAEQQSPGWKPHSRLQVPRTHTAIGHAGQFLVVAGGNEYDYAEGGYSANTIRDTTEVLDLTEAKPHWQQKSRVPGGGRGWCASVSTPEHVYLFGGLTWKAGNMLVGRRETLRYTPAADEWETLTPAPLAVSGWEGALYKGRYALMAGGVVRSASKPAVRVIWSDLMWACDLQTNQWLRVEGVLPPGAVFNDPGVAVVDDVIYVLGAEGPHGSHYNYLLKGRIHPVER